MSIRVDAEVQALLVVLRQHPAFQRFLRAVPLPRPPHYRPSSAKSLDVLGAELASYSGKRDQHDAWLALLTGQSPNAHEETNEQRD